MFKRSPLKAPGPAPESDGSAYWRGLAVCLLVSLAARFLADHFTLPLMLSALLLGLALPFVWTQPGYQPGIELASRQVLRWGVALLGLRVSVEHVMALGWSTVLMVLLAVLATMGLGLLLARSLGLRQQLGLLTGGAVGICGASAALALAACLPRDTLRERELAWTVMGASVLSTMAMLIYPAIAHVLALDERQTGIFLGASIHDVAQVLGAGYSVSSVSGDTAILTKLLRVAMLVPVVLVVSLALAWHLKPCADTHRHLPRTPLLPGFLLVFVALMLLQSVLTFPPSWLALGQSLSQWALVMAMAAIGLKIQPAQWRAMGWRPLVLLLAESVFLAIWVLGWLMLDASNGP